MRVPYGAICVLVMHLFELCTYRPLYQQMQLNFSFTSAAMNVMTDEVIENSFRTTGLLIWSYFWIRVNPPKETSPPGQAHSAY